MIFLAIDIGNTNTVIGIYQDKKLISSWRLVSSHTRTIDEYWIVTKLFCDNAGVNVDTIEGAIIGSVVPELTENYRQMAKQYFHLDALIVSHELKLGFDLKVDHPASVGADRICNVTAARERYSRPAIIVDLGTATTFDVIDDTGDYIGGAIAPGIYTASYELSKKASKLSKIELKNPSQFIAKNTAEHLECGIFTGHIAMIEGLIDRMIREYGKTTSFSVIATGGLSEEITHNCSVIQTADKTLTLEGLRHLFTQNS